MTGRRQAQGGGDRQAGFTLLEVMVASALITLGLLALLLCIPALMNVSRGSRETQIATSAIRSQLDDMRSAPFPDPVATQTANIFNMYNGATFTAIGLTSAIGTVTFLPEATAAQLFGSPVDFNSDGVTSTATTIDATYSAYPCRLELSWVDGSNSPRSISLTTIIYNINK